VRCAGQLRLGLTFVLGRRSPSRIVEGIRIVGAQPIAASDAKVAQFLAGT